MKAAQQQMTEKYDTLIEKILSHVNLDGVSIITRDELIASIVERLNRVVNKTVIESLNQEDLALFEDEVKKGKSPIDVILALTKNKPDIRQKLEKALDDLTEQMIREITSTK